jgi:hypothetical protein
MKNIGSLIQIKDKECKKKLQSGPNNIIVIWAHFCSSREGAALSIVVVVGGDELVLLMWWLGMCIRYVSTP